MSGFNATQQSSPNTGRRAPVLEPGSYPARLVGLITFGIQKQNPYEGQEKPPVAELHTTYELVDEFMPDDEGNPDESKPRWISETLAFHNLTQDKAKSTKRYLALDPDQEKGGDWSEVLGSAVLVSIAVKDGKGKNAGNKYENISGTASMRAKEAVKLPGLVNEPRMFDFYEPDLDKFLALPEWIQKKMKEALDYEGSKLEALVEAQGSKAETKKKEAKKEVVKEEDDDEGDW